MENTPGLDSRRAALAMLSAVLDKRQTLAAAPDSLSPPDRAFALLLAKTSLRRLGQLDALINEFLASPLPPNMHALRHVLRIGLSQLLFLGTPAHAAVHTTVELARQAGLPRFAKLVNALMQRGVREGAALLAAQDAAQLNTPPWLWESWRNAYGEEAARAFATRHLEEAPLDITVKDDAGLWAEALGGMALNARTVRRQEAGGIASLPGYAEGAWWVQDVAASVPAQWLLEALGGGQGRHIVDLCAAPGGKTAQLAASGAEVTAVDITRARIRRLEENLTRLQLQAECICEDALRFTPARAPHAILLDAPCSATGTLRRHPEIARHRHPEDVARLADLQKRLLAHAWQILPPGALLCYAVCSLQPEEGARQIAAFLSANPATLLRESTPAPEQDGDGFYIALLRKDAGRE